MKTPSEKSAGRPGFSIPLLFMHLACAGVFFVPGGWPAFFIFVLMYVLHVFALTAGYHRYFSHKTYQTSRTFQFVLALLGTTAAQRDPLWWASHHRMHHMNSDTEDDVHSPRHHGFWWAHIGWVMNRQLCETDLNRVKDFSKYPELLWLNRHPYIPAFALAILLLGAGSVLNLLFPTLGVSGWQFVFYGFFLSTVAVYHVTFCINSVAHLHGRRRYDVADDSRNNWVLGLVAMGEGWHNNHHRYAVSTRQGFQWWEIDLSYWILRALQRVGLVWGIREPPRSVLTERKP
ncbi:acyl-CoA desaturase [Pontiella agarivorans]|uniref:Acyl-CoA desaturase n=1 Tax=Pontiella agarivorans TaxID=3038953 RepID=A0ABU5MYR7_9BACT|nr:acyl-CoA desaturase [Pontiella agarivorans]MDZ8119313.1 acyl-CoA desaturase [Pontiella agarivorans]